MNQPDPAAVRAALAAIDNADDAYESGDINTQEWADRIERGFSTIYDAARAWLEQQEANDAT